MRPVSIDPNSNVVEVASAIAAAIEAIGQKRGWDIAGQVVEAVLMRLVIGSWVDKAPGAAARLKRIYQAVRTA